jgi:hypothetical protein
MARGVRPLYLSGSNGLADGDLVELLVDGSTTSLQARIVLDPQLPNSVARLDAEGATLGGRSGTAARIRRI